VSLDPRAGAWDPATYLRFADERARPFTELLARVRAASPRVVVDLGCGAGALTASLAQRWPGARITGIDSSPEMLAAAAAHAVPGRVAYARGDVRAWRPAEPVDVLLSNAVLHWVPGHERLLDGWAAALAPGGELAVQVPATSGRRRTRCSPSSAPGRGGPAGSATRPRAPTPSGTPPAGSTC
jgi:trans-aconitate 2-methyltransferase